MTFGIFNGFGDLFGQAATRPDLARLMAPLAAEGALANWVWMTVLSPAYLPGWNLMLDIPAQALGLFALTAFIRACDRRSFSLAVAAGLSARPREPLEAANVDGASAVQRLRYVVLPMLRPAILVALLIRSMDAIRYYDIIWVTTAGGPADSTKIIPIRLYETAFRFFNLGYAAAIGLSMLVVTISLGKLFVGFMTKGDIGVARG